MLPLKLKRFFISYSPPLLRPSPMLGSKYCNKQDKLSIKNLEWVWLFHIYAPPGNVKPLALELSDVQPHPYYFLLKTIFIKKHHFKAVKRRPWEIAFSKKKTSWQWTLLFTEIWFLNPLLINSVWNQITWNLEIHWVPQLEPCSSRKSREEQLDPAPSPFEELTP